MFVPSRPLTTATVAAIVACLVVAAGEQRLPSVAALDTSDGLGTVAGTEGASPGPPANDDFGSPTAIAALPFTDSVDTSAATTEPDEPRPLCGGGVASVWYSFTPPDDVLLVADTQGSDFGTALAVWTEGTASLELVTCSNTFALPYSRFAFQARGGQTYFFQAGGFYPDDPAGNLVFHVYVGVSPANDDFADATSIAGLPFTDSLDTLTATSQANEPRPACGIGEVAASVWYSFTPDEDVILVAGSAGSEFFHPVVAVYQGSAVDQLTPVACSAFSRREARVGFEASAEQTYFFQVGMSTAFEGLVPGTFITGKLQFSLDSILIPVCPAPQFSVSDPAGDRLHPWLPSNAPDVISVSGGADAEKFCLTVEFTGQVDPPDAGTDGATFAWILFDTDEDPDTGYESGTDSDCRGDAGLGVDAGIDLSGGYGVLVPSHWPGVPDSLAFFNDTSLTLSIPLGALGDGPPFGFVLLVGHYPSWTGMPTLIGPSDCVPDEGAIHWPAGAGDAGCDGSVDSIDAAIVLQFYAGLISSLPCQDAADADRDGRIDSRDAALILQYHAGLIESLPV